MSIRWRRCVMNNSLQRRSVAALERRAATVPLTLLRSSRTTIHRTMNDLKFAFRQLLKHPGYTTVAVLTLALGIGANTAIFQLLNAVRLKTLPVWKPQELIEVRIIGRYPRVWN